MGPGYSTEYHHQIAIDRKGKPLPDGIIRKGKGKPECVEELLTYPLQLDRIRMSRALTRRRCIGHTLLLADYTISMSHGQRESEP